MNAPVSPPPPPAPPTRRLRRLLLWLLTVTAAAAVLWVVTVEVALWRAAACLTTRQHDRALFWLRVAKPLSYRRAEWHYLQARCQRRLGRFSEVQFHLQRALELGWEGADLQREHWLALAQTNQFDQVDPHWAALFEHPGSDGPEISRAYVTECFARFRFAAAERVLAAWESDYPLDAEPHFQRGRLAETALGWSDAVRYFRQALELDPQRTDARLGLGRALVKQGEVQKAEEQLRQACAEWPNDVPAKIAYAQCLLKLNRGDEARRLLEEAVQAAPQDVDALLELGNVELSAGAHAAALRHLEQAVQRKPESREVVYAYATALKKNGRADEAVKYFKFVDEATRPLLQLKNLSNQLLTQPDNVDLRYQVALITWRYKSREDGERWFRSLLKIDPRHPPTHAALAEHYALAGDPQRAAEHRRMAGLEDAESPPPAGPQSK